MYGRRVRRAYARSLGSGRGRWLGGLDRRGAPRPGGVRILLVEQDRGQPLSHVPFGVAGEHAQEHMDGDADCFDLDSTSVKVPPDGTGARKTNGPQSIGKSRGGWHAKIHMVSASGRQAVIFRLSGGNAHDAPEGRALLESAGPIRSRTCLRRWIACEGDETRRLVEEMGMTPVVPPKANRKVERNYDRETCKLRNGIERLFRRFKGCRRPFTRYDKFDAKFPGFLNLAVVVEMMYDLA